MSNFSFRSRCLPLLLAAPLVVCGLAATTASAHAQTRVGARSPSQSQSSPLHIEGTVIKTFFLQSEAVVRVTSVTPFHGEATVLNPPRVKFIKFRDAEIPDNLIAGTSFTADGKDAGRGKPLRVARITIAGIETVFSELEFGTDATPDDPSGVHNIVPAGDAASPTPPPMPDPHVVDSLERGRYECWPRKGDKGDNWGAALNSALSGSGKSKTHLAGADTAPRAFVLLQDGSRVEGSRLLTLEATGYGPTDNGDWGDQTALSTIVGFGTVAVDPRIIPLGKHLWVEGYGFCIALDTGGAIKGMRIDLGQDSEEEAEAVGRQKRRVLVLD